MVFCLLVLNGEGRCIRRAAVGAEEAQNVDHVPVVGRFLEVQTELSIAAAIEIRKCAS